MNKKFGLGKGLDALIEDYASTSPLVEVQLEQLKESPYQPRLTISKESLSELIDSIKENGIIEPLVVRKKEHYYELIAGHRRLSALQYLKKPTAPVYILDISDQKAAELTVVENIQRLDLNPVELAHSIQQMIKSFKLTHEQIAKSLGKSRVYITNTLRLLSLDENSIQALKTQHISEGHGRLLLQIPDLGNRNKALQNVITNGWSVKQLSNHVQQLQQPRKIKSSEALFSKKDIKLYETKLSSVFNTLVKIKGKKIELYFKEASLISEFINKFN